MKTLRHTLDLGATAAASLALVSAFSALYLLSAVADALERKRAPRAWPPRHPAPALDDRWLAMRWGKA